MPGASAFPRTLALALSLAAVLWTAALVFATVGPTRGIASFTPGVVNAVSSVVCHRRPERSFHVDSRQFPVCGRCTGLYVAGALGAIAGWFGAARAPRRTRRLMIWAALPTAVSVGAEWAGLYDGSTALRALLAVPLGATAGWVFVRMLRAESAPSTCAMIA